MGDGGAQDIASGLNPLMKALGWVWGITAAMQLKREV